ncbi:hypothetical protein HPB50_002367 [Hyalomma asiaticum]|uniref:Uncharacterized protein n=1 Tax=Hyalomma asiaticum TaxID=266040 RepID=A0ACB7T9S1_HYAAI|nr:hypothetical protein HPB50_002367 [Hyalomma asiaticum]
MACSTKALLGDRAVKDAPGVSASGGPAISHRLDAPAAAHGRLLSELKEKLLVVGPKSPSPKATTGLNVRDNSFPSVLRGSRDGHRTSTRPRPPGESSKHFPPLTKPVPSCSYRQHADVQVRVTLRGPFSVRGATAEGTQAETATKYNKAPNGFRQSGLVCRLVNCFNEKASLQNDQVRAAVDVSKKEPPRILCETPPAGDVQSHQVSEGKREEKEDGSQNCSSDGSCQGEGEGIFHLLSFEQRRQRVHEVLAYANETMDEMRRSMQDSQAQAAVNVSKEEPSDMLCATPPAGDEQSAQDSEAKSEQKEDLIQSSSGDTSCQGEETIGFRLLPFEEHQQRVRDAFAHITETLEEMCRDMSNVFPTEERFATVQSQTSPMSKPSDDIGALLSMISELSQEVVDAETDKQLLEEDYDDSMYPLISSRRCVVIDKIEAINDQIQLQWATVYAEIQRRLNSRLRQTLADCRSCPGDDAGVPQEELPSNATEAQGKLVAYMRADLHAACADFDKWRTEYLQGVFRESCAALDRRQRLWILGMILNEEIFISAAVFERRIRTRVAVLWKKLVVRRELDLHA